MTGPFLDTEDGAFCIKGLSRQKVILLNLTVLFQIRRFCRGQINNIITVAAGKDSKP